MASRYLAFGALLIVIYLNNVQSDSVLPEFDIPDPSTELDECYKLCNKTYEKPTKDVKTTALATSVTNEADACGRGCRFFRIADMLIDADGTVVNDFCQGCCDDSYVDDNRKSCHTGCSAMTSIAAEPVEIKSSFSISIIVDDADNGNKIDNDDTEQQSSDNGDIEMDNVLTDPALWSQLTFNLADDSKLPEMKIKTLPIDSEKMVDENLGDDSVVISESQSGCFWWLSNALEINVPPCIIAALLILLIFLLLRILFSCEVRKELFEDSSHIDGTNTNKFAVWSPYKTTQYTPLSPKEKEIYECYSPDNQQNLNKIPPPKYDEAIHQCTDDANGDIALIGQKIFSIPSKSRST